MGNGMSMKSNMEATTEWSKQGDKVMYRMDLKGTSSQNMGGQETKMDSTSSMICDGEFTYTVAENMGQKMAMKQKLDPQQSGDVKAVFSGLKEDSNLKVLPEEKIDGTTCVVLEAVAKQAEGSPISRTLMYFAKETGITMKAVGLDKSDKPVFTMTVSDVKINTEIKPDRFVFKAPEGVVVQDMTK
jgi:outer membrane lipoprotein-sorting protein